MAQLTVEKAVARGEKAWTAKANWESTLGDAMRIIHPHRDGFNSYSPGQKKEGGGKTWDSTASVAATRGANQMMGLTPPFEDWIILEPGPAAEFGLEPDKLRQLRIELQALGKQCNALVQMGGFASSVHEMWIDWLYSTGAMTVDPVTPPAAGPLVIFRSVPLSEFMIEEGPHGVVDTWHRRFKLAGRNIITEWPDAKIPEELQRKIEAKPDVEIELFEITYRDYDPAAAKKPFRYEVFTRKGKEKHRLVERQEQTPRWLTPRNVKVAGEQLGRGQLLQLMPDIRTLNTIVEVTMRAAMLNLLGIYTSDDPAFNENTIKMRPGIVINVRRNGGPMGASLQRLDQANVRLDFSQLLVEELRQQIKVALFDNALPPDAGPVRSATEIVHRMRQLAVDLGGSYGRIVNEFVQPLVQRLIDILERLNLVQTKDLKVDQFFIRVRVSSPVARAQSLGQVEQLVQWLTIISETGGQEAMMLAALMEDVYAEIGRLLGVPEKVMRPLTEQKETMKKLQSQAQAEVAANETAAPRRDVAA